MQLCIVALDFSLFVIGLIRADWKLSSGVMFSGVDGRNDGGSDVRDELVAALVPVETSSFG